jgi:hypothetical protein
MLEPIRHDSQRKGLHLGLSLGRRAAVREDTRKFGHLGKPAPVLLAFNLYPELHDLILLPCPECPFCGPFSRWIYFSTSR